MSDRIDLYDRISRALPGIFLLRYRFASGHAQNPSGASPPLPSLRSGWILGRSTHARPLLVFLSLRCVLHSRCTSQWSSGRRISIVAAFYFIIYCNISLLHLIEFLSAPPRTLISHASACTTRYPPHAHKLFPHPARPTSNSTVPSIARLILNVHILDESHPSRF